MRTTTRLAVVLAGATVSAVAATTLGTMFGSATAVTADRSAPAWKSERGIVTECTGKAHGLRAYASVYENQRYGNVVQVVLGSPDAGNGASRSTTAKFLVDGKLRAAVRVDGKRAVVKGRADRVGKRTPVREQREDAGQLIEVKGYHRQLRTDLVLRYGDKRVPLTCDPAFYFNLQVKKTPIQ